MTFIYFAPFQFISRGQAFSVVVEVVVGVVVDVVVDVVDVEVVVMVVDVVVDGAGVVSGGSSLFPSCSNGQKFINEIS